MPFIPDTKKLQHDVSQLQRVCAGSSDSGVINNILKLAQASAEHGGPQTLVPLLPLLLTLKGEPYTLKKHFVFEPFFKTRLPSDILLRTGRQVSKTGRADSQFNRVYDEYGRRYRLSDISPGQFVQSFDPTTFQICRQKVLAQHKNPRKVCYYIRTRRGVEMELAGTHPLYTYNGWTAVDELDVGARIAHARCGGRFGNKKVDEQHIRDTARALPSNKSIPGWVFLLSRAGTRLFIEQLWAATGATADTYTAESRDLVYDLKSLLAKFGVRSSVSRGRRVWRLHAETRESSLCSRVASPHKDAIDWDEIVEIRNIGEHECVDIEVEETHSYLLDGVASHNSTSLASQGVLSTACLNYFNTLYVTPLFEMVRRFSNNYIREFIEGAVFKRLWSQGKGRGNVLQRSFSNGSNMFFSYAFLDAERTRGVNADRVCFDEVQNLMHEFIPVILETLSGSKWGLKQYAGTPKTKNNTIERLWRMSSMAEWFIRCQTPGCGHWNIPALEYDLLEMIGPDREDIAEDNAAVICTKCAKPLRPETGSWVHRHPNRLATHPAYTADFAGYHVPQLIMPMHYGNRDKWRALLAKRHGAYNTSEATFLNEVCGEACDVGTKLVSETDLENAGTLHENTLEAALAASGNYHLRLLAVDWGGGGLDGVSWTVAAVLGCRDDGQIDVLYGVRSLTPHDHEAESLLCLQLLEKFRCRYLVHDYNGAGAYREQYITAAGFPASRVIPMVYVRTGAQGLMRRVDATEQHPRTRYHLDKPRSLVLTCHQLKTKRIQTFKYDNKGAADPGLLSDFLALMEDKVSISSRGDIYNIVRAEGQTDDFAHAVNFGACAIWWHTQNWPNLAPLVKYQISDDLVHEISPQAPRWDWTD